MKTWLSFPISGFLAVLLVAVLAYHSYLGTTVVVEDYVHCGGMKVLICCCCDSLYVLAGGAGIFAILRVAFGS